MPKIFESPDKGKTVYARNFGEHQKYVYHTQSIINDILWKEIRDYAEHDNELKNLLDRVKILYYLKKTDDSKT